MISFEQNNCVFNYRVAGVYIQDGRVLLHRSEEDNFWTFPGGRCEIGELSADTIVREMREETGASFRVIRLLFVIENMFVYHKVRCHEIGFYYLMKPETADDTDKIKGRFFGREGTIKLEFDWFPINSLAKMEIYPILLKTALLNLPNSICHLVQKEQDF